MKLAAILVCLAVFFSAAEAQCPLYWTRGGDSCYRYFGYPLPWFSAESVCNMFSSCSSSDKVGGNRGLGHLVSINSMQENQFVYGFLINIHGEIPPQIAWLGLIDNHPQHEWVWSDRTQLTYTAWDQDSPMQNSQFNCVVFNAELVTPRWTDIACNEEAPYVCEIPMSPDVAGDACTAPPGAAPVPIVAKAGRGPNAPPPARQYHAVPGAKAL